MQGVFATEGGRTVVRNGTWQMKNGSCSATVTATKQ
jgi:hypothetical protein